MHTHTPTLNHNHSCRERESERSTVAKSQNALHFSLCDINQFFPARHNLPRGWFHSERHKGFPKRHHHFSLFLVSCRVSCTQKILIGLQWEKDSVLSIEYYQSYLLMVQSRRGNWTCKVTDFQALHSSLHPSLYFSVEQCSMERDAPVICSPVPLKWIKTFSAHVFPLY